jgi:hypothetical protein
MTKLAFEDWLTKMEAILKNGTENQKESARWQMGYKIGRRQAADKILARLEAEGILYWSEQDQVWLSMLDGKAVRGLDWRETNY